MFFPASPPPAPPQLIQGIGTELPPAIQARVDAHLKAQDWAGLADFIEAQDAKLKGQLLETWLRALNKAGRYEHLLEICNSVIPRMEGGKEPRLSTARLFKAQALSRLQRHQEAMEAHAETGRLGHLDGYVSACAEARLLQDWKALEACAEALLLKKPEDGTAMARKGEALCKQGRYEEAEPILQGAVTRAPDEAMAWADLAACRYARRAYPEALEAADRALGIDLRLMEGLYNRATTLLALQRYEEARDAFQACLDQKPDAALDRFIQAYLQQLDRYLDGQKKASQSGKPKK